MLVVLYCVDALLYCVGNGVRVCVWRGVAWCSVLCCVGGAVWCSGKGMEVGGGVVRSFSKKYSEAVNLYDGVLERIWKICLSLTSTCDGVLAEF